MLKIFSSEIQKLFSRVQGMALQFKFLAFKFMSNDMLGSLKIRKTFHSSSVGRWLIWKTSKALTRYNNYCPWVHQQALQSLLNFLGVWWQIPSSSSDTELIHLCYSWQCPVLGCPTDTDQRWLPIRLRFYKNSVFCRLSERIRKASNMLARCTRGSTAFHWVQQVPEASLSVCFKEQDTGYQPCKNTLWGKERAALFTAHLAKDPLCYKRCCQETCGYSLCFASPIFCFLFSRKASAMGGWKRSWFSISSKRNCSPTSEKSLELCPV